MIRDNICYQKAVKKGQETFTLVEQDLTSPAVIIEWIKQNLETAPEVKLIDAFETAMRMRSSKQRKHAD